MSTDDLLREAEENVRVTPPSKKASKDGSGGKLKGAIAVVLFLVFAATAINGWNQIRRMNMPPEIPEEVLHQNMGGYLFITVSKLNAFIEREGRIPANEEELLGYDDPTIEYEVYSGGYSVAVVYGDTSFVWRNGDDISQFLTVEALERMGVK
jgi:hypothetical protein